MNLRAPESGIGGLLACSLQRQRRLRVSAAGEAHLVDSDFSLKIDGAGDTRVLVKNVQLDPITHRPLHTDFYRVNMDRKITVINSLTGGHPEGAHIPIHFDTDRECLEAAVSVIGLIEPHDAKIVWIHNTLDLATSALRLEDHGLEVTGVAHTPRIGIRVGTDKLWRATANLEP